MGRQDLADGEPPRFGTGDPSPLSFGGRIVLTSKEEPVGPAVALSPASARRSWPISPKVLVAAGVVVLSAGFLFVTALQNNAVYYLTVTELHAATPAIYGQPVRVAGKVVAGSIERDPTSLLVRFDAEDDSGRLPVTYRGVVPDIFGDGIEVVVEGRYAEDGMFTAGTLLAKCPSKFEAG
jgi:cytochrome c-type biogenesis protein CcmE